MNKPYIIFDADGVLLDTLPYFIKWFIKNVPNFDIKKFLEGKMSYIINEFASNNDIFSNIPPMQDAVETINCLSKNYTIDVISAYGGTMNRFVGRNENIAKFFGNSINYVLNIPKETKKGELYKQYAKNTIVIDDDLFNCIQAQQLGLRTFWYKYYSLISPIINQRDILKLDKGKITPISSFKEIKTILSR